MALKVKAVERLVKFNKTDAGGGDNGGSGGFDTGS